MAEQLEPRRAVTARDIIELRDFGDPWQDPSMDPPFALSPDRRHIAIALRRADISSNSYCYGIMLLSLDDGTRRLLDEGGEPLIMSSDYFGRADKPNGTVTSSPLAWSPDGQWVAYMRRDHGRTQVWRVALEGNTAEQVTHAPVDVRRFSWSSDGTAIHFTTRPGIPDAIATFAEEGRSGFHFDERFWPLSANRPLPQGDVSFVEQTIDLTTHAVSSVQASSVRASGKADAITRPDDPATLAWLGTDQPTAFLSPIRLKTSSQGREQVCSAPACTNVTGFWWDRDGSILFLHDESNSGGGRLTLYRWRPGPTLPVRLWQTDALLIGCVLLEPSFFCAQEAADQPRRLVRVAVRNGAITPLFDPNPEWTALRTGSVETLAAVSADSAPGFARLVLPPDYRPGEHHPLVVVQYTSRGFLRGGTGDEYPIHLLADRGYAVLSFHKPPQPGADPPSPDLDTFVRRNLAGLAERRRNFTALTAAIDAAIARGVVDPERVAITGLSDGASTVAYAMLHSRRFATAILSTCCDEPSFTQFLSGPAYAASTEKWGYPGYGEEGFWPDFSLAQNAEKVATPPILIQASDEEYRMALETVAALRAAQRPIDMYVFPNEMHIKWQPEHRAAIYARVIDWLDFWLRGKEDAVPAKETQYRRWHALAESVPARASALPDP
ncbi:Atxe2 family lasso peptide isopeptidase [Aurantiacibacter xanthus]|uniref:Atxe2 family lasso peptide isopeptidase n=1 Tax=Aurantiacibacter xanthus TaxID=1784712 RepID=UPI001C725DD8|nr:Atxe2 family lasso peptide isopeptidase [Aurantiacibacter xanthus]